MSRKRRPSRVHGMALIHKPRGPTSFRVMRTLQRQIDAAKAGHGGTLDPMASGLLIVLLGEATKLTPWVQGRDKRYRATVRFGRSTDTLDAEGSTVESAPVPKGLIQDSLVECLTRFVGDRPQRPPKYSALKVNGRTHMSRARAGEEFEVAERPALCHSIEVVERNEESAVLDLHVGSGYYVRSLARDLGDMLGVPSHLEALVRTQVGPWSLRSALAPEAMSLSNLVPLADALPDVPVTPLGDEDALAIRQGKRIEASLDAPVVMVTNKLGVPLAMVDRVASGEWRVLRGFAVESQELMRLDDSLIDKEAPCG